MWGAERAHGRELRRRALAAALLAVAVVAVVAVRSHGPAIRLIADRGIDRRSGPGGGGKGLPGLAAGQSVTLNWVGDMAMSSENGLPPGGVRQALAPMAHLLADADITTGNLEGTLSVGGASKCGDEPSSECFAFQAPPSVAGDLHALHFGVVSQANNHALDYGPSGQAQTLAALRGADVRYTGLPGQITVVRDKALRVAFLGFAPYPYTSNLLDIPAAAAQVARARREANVVVVFIHAGAEGADQTHTPYGSQYFLGEDRGDARAFAHAVINAGATIVFGSGPHVVRGIEDYRGHLIAYSLGNFLGYHTLAGGGVLSESGLIHVTLGAGDRVTAARWYSVILDGGLPRPDPTNASAHLITTLSTEDFRSDHPQITADGRILLPRPQGR